MSLRKRLNAAYAANISQPKEWRNNLTNLTLNEVREWLQQITLFGEKGLTEKLIDCDVYRCDSNGHLILIQASKERNEAEDVIRCPYHKCGAEIESTMTYYLEKDVLVEVFAEAKKSLEDAAK